MYRTHSRELGKARVRVIDVFQSHRPFNLRERVVRGIIEILDLDGIAHELSHRTLPAPVKRSECPEHP
jgi:hypothetical protein